MELTEREEIIAIKRDVKYLIKGNDRMEAMLVNQEEANNKKYAGKWTEKFVAIPSIATVFAILGAVWAFLTGR